MQPLTLHVAGLHSFRAPVEIDLATLGQHGLFGIFGPVGSGKSTLLDAMTLALYGQVDRLVGRSKRGIVNHQAKRCEVRLRFRSRSEEWEVQRAYRADRDGVAQRIHSRLARATPTGLSVVADKEREVNATVESLLGLSAEDFMRAVVLPQGRFMQFLHLQGTERRRMLQRIFHLEPFGEGLRGRVKRETDRVSSELQHALGELEGLGAADRETLERAEQAWIEATAAASVARARHQEATAALESIQRSAAHHQALQGAVAALAAHLVDADRITNEQEDLVRAARIRPVLDRRRRRDHARTTRAEALRSHTASEARAARAQTAAQADAATLETARRDRVREEPELKRSRDALVQATRTLAELEQAVAEAAKIGQQRSQLQRKVDTASRKQATLETRLSELVARRTSLRSRFTELEVTVERRARLQTAERARQRLEQARAQVETANSQAKGATARCEAARAAETRAREALEAGQARSLRAARDRDRLMAQLDALAPISEAVRTVRRGGLVQRLTAARSDASNAASAVEVAQQAVAAAEATLQALPEGGLDRTALHGVLARDLADGEACAVCGSTEHPEPAAVMHQDDVLAVLAEHATATAELAARRRAASEALARSAACQEAQAVLEQSVPPALLDADDLSGCVAREEQSHAALMHAVSRTERSLQGLRPGLEDARALHISAQAHRASAEEESQRIETDLAEGTRHEGEAWGALTDALGEVTVFDLPRLVAEIAEHDTAREALRPELEALEKELDKAQRTWEERQRTSAERSAEMQRIQAEHDAVERRRTGLLETLRELSPSGDPTAELARVRASLETLETAEVSALERQEASRVELSDASAARAGADAALQAAITAETREEQELTTAAQEAGLDPEDEALESAALPGVDLAARQESLRQWFEARAALSHRVEELKAIDLPVVSDTAAESATAESRAAETGWRQAETERVRTEERHVVVSERAVRFAELEHTQKQLGERAEQLRTLMRLLRGDKFVEYVANDYLTELCAEASRHLATLTRGRYALELDASGAFLVADLDAGAAVRPASSLSGGETFVTSLALALALSTQVQQHNDQPLEFFFLDEGFGSLDPEALDRVMTSIEALADSHRVIGLISHVGAVRERVPRFLSLTCPRDGGGTRVEVVDG